MHMHVWVDHYRCADSAPPTCQPVGACCCEAPPLLSEAPAADAPANLMRYTAGGVVAQTDRATEREDIVGSTAMFDMKGFNVECRREKHDCIVQIFPPMTLAVGAVVEGGESNSRRTWLTPRPFIEVLVLVAALATALVDSCILGVALLRTTTNNRDSLASASLPRYNSACFTPPNVIVR